MNLRQITVLNRNLNNSFGHTISGVLQRKLDNRRNAVLYFLLVLLTFFNLSFAGKENVATYGMDTQKIVSSARPLGMGNAYVAVADDISALTWNAAGLANFNEHQFLFTHYNYFTGLNFEGVGYAIPTKFCTIGLNFNFFTFTMNEYDLNYTSIGNSVVSNQIYTFAFGKKFGTLFALGLSTDLNVSRFSSYSASFFRLNFAGLWYAPYELVFGATVKNIGPGYHYQGGGITGEYISLPLTLQVGAARNFIFPGLGKITFTADTIMDNTLGFNFGTEYRPVEFVTLRAGYNANGFTLGLGLAYKFKGLDKLHLDYAFVPINDLPVTHNVSIITKF